MPNENLVTLTQFNSNPELQQQFGGDYGKYLNKKKKTLQSTSTFRMASQGYRSVPDLNRVSLFFGTKSIAMVPPQDTKKMEEMEKLLDGIKDAKTREIVKKAMVSGNPSRAFIDMLIERHEKHQAEFEEVWAQYQATKNQTQLYKKICEQLLKEYETSQSVTDKTNYNNAYKNYADADLNKEILLDKAMDISHRVIV